MMSIKDIENTFLIKAQEESKELGIPIISSCVFNTYKADIDSFVSMIKNQILYKIIVNNIKFGDKGLLDDIIHLYSIFAFIDANEDMIEKEILDTIRNIIFYSEYYNSNMYDNIIHIICINKNIRALKNKFFTYEKLKKSKEVMDGHLSESLPIILNHNIQSDRIQYVYNLIDICAVLVAFNQFKYNMLYYENSNDEDKKSEVMTTLYREEIEFKNTISCILF